MLTSGVSRETAAQMVLSVARVSAGDSQQEKGKSLSLGGGFFVGFPYPAEERPGGNSRITRVTAVHLSRPGRPRPRTRGKGEEGQLRS